MKQDNANDFSVETARFEDYSFALQNQQNQESSTQVSTVQKSKKNNIQSSVSYFDNNMTKNQSQ